MNIAQGRVRQSFLIVLDACFLSLSWIASYWIRFWLTPLFDNPVNPFRPYLIGLPLIIASWLLIGAGLGLYRRPRELQGIEQIRSLLKLTLLGLLVTMSISFLFREFQFARSVVLVSSLSNLVFLGLSRGIFRRIEKILKAEGQDGVKALIVGAGYAGARILQKLQDHPTTAYRVVGFLDDSPDKKDFSIGKARVIGRLTEIRKVVQSEGLEEVFVAIPNLPHSQILELVMECEGLDVDFHIVSDLFGVLAHETRIELLEDFPIFDLSSGQTDRSYQVAKRAFDLALTLPASLVFFLTCPLIALAIRLESRGPVIFKQERVGLGGKVFILYKYRTMFIDAPAYAEAPRQEGDSRVTRVGRFLRKTSLDELPNLLNVLRGDMSLVGPRPEMPFIVEKYQEWQRKRLEVKPGLTGLWQILGRKDLPLHENLEYDFYYIKNRSLLLDFTILLRTIPALLITRGAY
jgi:exopolysaccharide biosynthesis polyprenyl glycosylphosphotransferase